jgi:proteasome assembly chaperone 2
MGQLVVYLLISFARARRVAYLDEPSVLPCVGNDAFGPDAVGDLALALEGWVLDPCCHSVLFLPRI